MSQNCPICTDGGTVHLLRLPQLPVRCEPLVASLEIALRTPRGDIALCFCPACGHLFNERFEQGRAHIETTASRPLEQSADACHVLRQIKFPTEQHNTTITIDATDVEQLIDTQFVWHLNYGQCHYFSVSSLYAAVTRAGHYVHAWQRSPDATTLRMTIAAEAAAEPPASPTPLTIMQAEAFADRLHAKIAEWTVMLTQMRQLSDRVVVWGTNCQVASFLNILPSQKVVDLVVSDVVTEQRCFVVGSGQMVIGLDDLVSYRPTVVIVVDESSRERIGRKLQAVGIEATILCA